MCPSTNRYRKSQWKVEAIVLPRITAKIPTLPVEYDKNWKNLAKLNLADPDFGIPSYIDILLGIDVFSKVIRQGQRKGPPGTPSAL